jgi:hypothetical protein
MLTIISAMGLPAVNHLLPIKTSELKKNEAFAVEPTVHPAQSFEDMLKQQEQDRKIKDEPYEEPKKIHEYNAKTETNKDNEDSKHFEDKTNAKDTVSESKQSNTENQTDIKAKNESGSLSGEKLVYESLERQNGKSESHIDSKQQTIAKSNIEKSDPSQSDAENQVKGSEKQNSFNSGLKKAGTRVGPEKETTNSINQSTENNHEMQSEKGLKELIKTRKQDNDLQPLSDKNHTGTEEFSLKTDKLKNHKISGTPQNHTETKQSTNTEKTVENTLQQTAVPVKEQGSKIEQHRETITQQNQNTGIGNNQAQHGFNTSSNLNREHDLQQGQKNTPSFSNEKGLSEANHKPISSESSFLQGLQDKMKSSVVSRETTIDESTRRQVQQQIDAAWNRARFQLKDQKNVTMNTSIYPKEMGRIQLSLSLIDGLLQARFIVDNETVQKEVMDKMQQMATELSNQGMKLSSFDVDLRQNQENQPDNFFNLNRPAKKAGINDYNESALSFELATEGVTYA